MLNDDARLKCTKRWKTMNYIRSNIFRLLLQHYQLPLPVSCLKNDHYWSKPSHDYLQISVSNSNASQKSIMSRVQQTMFVLICSLFISFPVRHTDNIRFDGRHFHWRPNGIYHNLEHFVQ